MMAELTQEQRTNIAALALEATMQGLDLMVVTDDRNRLLTALKALERDHIIIHPQFGKSCEWCGGETGHMDDCPFAVIAVVEDCDHDLPEPIDGGPALRAEFAQYQMGTRLRALLAGAVPLLELAAELVARLRCHNCPVHSRCPRFDSTTTTTASDWPCTTIPAKLRELAQGLREALGEEEG